MRDGSARGAGVGDDHDMPAKCCGAQQRGAYTDTHIGKTFTVWRAVCGQIGGRQGPKIGKVGEGQIFPIAEILLPQGGVNQGRRACWPKCLRGLHTAQSRADHQMIKVADPSAQGCKRRRVYTICRNIAPPGHPAIVLRGRMADQA